jgi:hypothetical protein
MSSPHLALQIELPCMFTDDIAEGGSLREMFASEHDSESDFILNCIGEPGVVRVRMEISGEKDGEVVEVWGFVRSASLVEPSRGFNAGSHLTDEQLAEQGGHKLMRDERACEWCAFDAESLAEDEA